MTNIQFLKDRIIFDGHADTRQECETITLLCDNLAQSKDFKTIRYESGYAEFEKVGRTEELKFAAAIGQVTFVFDNTVISVTNNKGSITASGESLMTYDTQEDSLTFLVALQDGYEIDTAVLVNDDSETYGTIDHYTTNIIYGNAGYSGLNGTITITTKQASTKQTIDVSTLSGWGELAVGEHSITVKVKASGYADSAASNAVTVTKAQPTAQYYGTLSDGLSVARRMLAATTVGNYALFGGGRSASWDATELNTVDAYDTSLTRTLPTALSQARSNLAATTIGNYALFGGGRSQSAVDAYNTSLTRTKPTALSVGRFNLAATTVGNYALFGGGFNQSAVDAYNTSLTRTLPTALSVVRYNLAATTVGNYALFGGGSDSTNGDKIDAYDTSLTRTLPTALSVAKYSLAATTIGNYALFGGGTDGSSSNIVDAYDTSLTRTLPTALSQARSNLAATTVGNYALFGGGTDGSSSNIVDAYDTSLTRTLPTALSVARETLAATTVGNYALFGGGTDGSSRNNFSSVDVYTVA